MNSQFGYGTVTFMVLPGNYYNVTGNVTTFQWAEWN